MFGQPHCLAIGMSNLVVNNPAAASVASAATPPWFAGMLVSLAAARCGPAPARPPPSSPSARRRRPPGRLCAARTARTVVPSTCPGGISFALQIPVRGPGPARLYAPICARPAPPPAACGCGSSPGHLTSRCRRSAARRVVVRATRADVRRGASNSWARAVRYVASERGRT